MAQTTDRPHASQSTVSSSSSVPADADCPVSSRDAMVTTATSSSPTRRRSNSSRGHAFGLLVRLGVPTVILAMGVGCFLWFSAPIEKETSEPEPPQSLRTRIVELEVGDYPVVITTNGTVAPHNQVTLSAEVTGKITSLSPSFDVGSYFRAGEVLAELDNRDYKTAVAVADAQLRSAKSALALAKVNFERQTSLLAKQAGSEAELQQAEATKAQAASEVDMLTAQLEQAQRDLKRTQVIAPFDGRVRSRSVGVGQAVSPTTSLGVVFAIDYAEIRLPIAGSELQFLQLPELSSDETVEVELRDAINPVDSPVWHAEIVRTEGALDENTLDLFAIARVIDPFGRKSGQPPLRLEQPVTATIVGKTLQDVVRLPRGAVRQLDQVFLVDKADLTLSSLRIDPLWANEVHMFVREPGIETGDWLAASRLVYAPEGATVEIIPDPMTEPTQTTASTQDTSQPVNN